MEAIKRSRVDLRLCGRNGMENSRTQLESSIEGSSWAPTKLAKSEDDVGGTDVQAELDASREVGPTG